MIPEVSELPIDQLGEFLRTWLKQKENRLGLLTSIDGMQLITLLLNTKESSSSLIVTPLDGDSYPSLTTFIPQTHWYERSLHDLFGLNPLGHPRLKPAVFNEACADLFAPLRNPLSPASKASMDARDFSYLSVAGDGIYELPVGPVHAGIIEPGHFRLSCLGEQVVNLEIRLGYLHRGVEKRLTEIPWTKARFVVEAAASDTACANALAHAEAIEALLECQVPPRAQYLRTIGLEVERLAMHVGDVGGMATDLGYHAVSAAASRLRGLALRMAELLSGSRYLRGFVVPGGVARDPDGFLSELKETARDLRRRLQPLLDFFVNNPSVYDRLRGVGVLSPSLAEEFGMVGVAARASNSDYDVRSVFAHAAYPQVAPPVTLDEKGDALSRTLVRVGEIYSSLDIIDRLVESMPSGEITCRLPSSLAKDSTSIGIVEAFRGELIHLIFTDGKGKIKRYAIKDPSVNNWTGLAIAERNNLVQDFPVCNKSFSLSYGGHDL